MFFSGAQAGRCLGFFEDSLSPPISPSRKMRSYSAALASSSPMAAPNGWQHWRLEFAEQLKEEGNRLVKTGQFGKARETYSQARTLLDFRFENVCSQ